MLNPQLLTAWDDVKSFNHDNPEYLAGLLDDIVANLADSDLLNSEKVDKIKDLIFEGAEELPQDEPIWRKIPMSDLSTRIFAKGLVDEGADVIELEHDLEATREELRELKRKFRSKKLVCPHCRTELNPVNFEGYYDEFAAWFCQCERFEDAEKQKGNYA